MRDTHTMANQAINFEYGYDRSKHDEWNTYAAENLEMDMFEEEIEEFENEY